MDIREKDIIATKQLIKVIRGDSISLDQESAQLNNVPDRSDAIRHHGFRTQQTILVVFITFMILFSILSIHFFTQKIVNLENRRDKMLFIRQDSAFYTFSETSQKQQKEVIALLDSLYCNLTQRKMFFSSMLKEISLILPDYCVLNNLNILVTDQYTDITKAVISMEGILDEDKFSGGTDISEFVKLINGSPLFQNVEIGYQNRSDFNDYHFINFQLTFNRE